MGSASEGSQSCLLPKEQFEMLPLSVFLKFIQHCLSELIFWGASCGTLFEALISHPCSGLGFPSLSPCLVPVPFHLLRPGFVGVSPTQQRGSLCPGHRVRTAWTARRSPQLRLSWALAATRSLSLWPPRTQAESTLCL